MIQRCQQPRFPLESSHTLRVAGKRIRQHFQRDFALQLGIFGAIHLAHAARANRLNDLIGSQASSGSHGHAMLADSTSWGSRVQLSWMPFVKCGAPYSKSLISSKLATTASRKAS